MKEKILQALKSEYKDLGVDAKVFDGVAESFAASGLITEENLASVIAGAKPALTSFEAEIGRRVNSYKSEILKMKEEKQKSNSNESKADSTKADGVDAKDAKDDDESTKLLRMIAEQNKALNDRLAAIEGGKVVETRKQALEAKLKDAPASFKSKILKDFSRMQFESEEDFAGYLEDTETDLGVAVQELADSGLGQQSKPLMGSVSDTENDVSPMMKSYLKAKAPKAEAKS